MFGVRRRGWCHAPTPTVGPPRLMREIATPAGRLLLSATAAWGTGATRSIKPAVCAGPLFRHAGRPGVRPYPSRRGRQQSNLSRCHPAIGLAPCWRQLLVHAPQDRVRSKLQGDDSRCNTSYILARRRAKPIAVGRNPHIHVGQAIRCTTDPRRPTRDTNDASGAEQRPTTVAGTDSGPPYGRGLGESASG